MICVDCGKEFGCKSSRQKRCKECQSKYNKLRRNELTKESNRIKKGITITPLPDRYLYLRDWANKWEYTYQFALRLISNNATLYGAIKVTNPHGGIDVWAIPESVKKCMVSGCEQKAFAKGYCRKHHQQITVHGRLTPELEHNKTPVCSVDGCTGKHFCKGYCVTHYRQYAKYGRITSNTIKRRKGAQKCLVDGCNTEQYSKGYCSKHYVQILHHGRLVPENEKNLFEKCTVEGCNNPCKCKGLCANHYAKHIRQIKKQNLDRSVIDKWQR